jgi:hypothetical protein
MDAVSPAPPPPTISTDVSIVSMLPPTSWDGIPIYLLQQINRWTPITEGYQDNSVNVRGEKLR